MKSNCYFDPKPMLHTKQVSQSPVSRYYNYQHNTGPWQKYAVVGVAGGQAVTSKKQKRRIQP